MIIGAMAAMCGTGSGLSPASAQAVSDQPALIDAQVQDRAAGALSVLGMSVIPNETASTLFFESDSAGGFSYQASQLGGGFAVSESFPLYLEGWVGFSRYDPVFVLSEGAAQRLLPAKWTAFSATGGIGWDFRLTDTLVLRPIVNIALGYVTSDANVLGGILDRRLDLELDFLDGGELFAGGLGGALMLDYEYVSEAYEIDSELRLTHVHLVPILASRGVDAESDSTALGWWNRLRVPTGLTALDNPLRAVLEVSGSLYSGDQAEVLQTDWMLQGGAGIEIDFADTGVPVITRGRLVARYAFGEALSGFSVGLAVSF